MYIDISKLSQGINKVELKGDAESLDLLEAGTRVDGPVLVDLDLNVFNEDIRIDGTIQTEVAEGCSRCLRPFKVLLKTEIHLYAAGRRTGGLEADAENEEEEAREGGHLFHDGRQLDLRAEIRSAILLSCPLQSLCSPDCKGLCPECGRDLNEGRCSCEIGRVDSRWKGLDKLRGEQE